MYTHTCTCVVSSVTLALGNTCMPSKDCLFYKFWEDPTMTKRNTNAQNFHKNEKNTVYTV